jgi:hypothetical protein
VKKVALTQKHLSSYPRGFLRAMGELAIEFGRAEYLVKLAYKDLRGLPFGEGLYEAERMNFSDLCEATKKLALETFADDDKRKKFVELIGAIKDYAQQRNDMIHAMWFRASPSATHMQRQRVLRNKQQRRLDWSRSGLLETNDVSSLGVELGLAWRYLHELRGHWLGFRYRG